MQISFSSVANSLFDILELPLKTFKFSAVWVRDYWNDWTKEKTAQIYSKHLVDLKLGSSNQELSHLVASATQLIQQKQKCRFDWSQRSLRLLEGQIIAYNYYLGEFKKVREDQIDQKRYQELCNRAQEWKKKPENVHYNCKELTSQELDFIKEIFKYDKFIEFLFEDPSLQGEFFNWVLANDNKFAGFQSNQVDVFLYKCLYKKYLRYPINSKNMWTGGKLLKIHPISQELECLIEGRYYPVNNKGEKITLRGHDGKGKLEMTVLEIIEAVNFQLEVGGGNIEVVDERGIWNYCPHRLGSYNADTKTHNNPDLSQDDWFQKIPPSRRLTASEVESKLGIDLKDYLNALSEYKEWKFCPTGKPPIYFVGATERGEMEMEGTHSYHGILTEAVDGLWELRTIGEFVIPFPEGGIQIPIINYKINHPIVKFIVKALKMLPFLPRWQHSYYFLLDQNMFYSWRKHAHRPMKAAYLTPKKWEVFTSKITKNIKKGWENRLAFHMAKSNCTTHLYHLNVKSFGEGSIPDLRKHWWELKPSGGLGAFFNRVKKIESIRNHVMTFSFMLFGAWMTTSFGQKKRAMWDQPWPWEKESVIHHPHEIFVEENEIKSEII